MVEADDLSRPQRALLGVVAALVAGESLQLPVAEALAAGIDAREIAALKAFSPSNATRARRDLLAACRAAGASLLEARPVHLSGFSTNVIDTGGSEPTLVLIHSMGLDYRATQHVVPHLAQVRRVITFDVRGHGLTASHTKLDSFAEAASDLRQLLDALDVDRAELVGLSMGGVLAQQFAADYPDRISALALVCTVAKGIPAMADRAETAERDGLSSLIGETLARWVGPHALAEDGWGVRYAREQLRTMTVAHWATAWRALARMDLEAALARITVPTKVIAGGEDVSSPPALMRAIADRIPGATFAIIPGAPHFVSLTNPRGLARALLA